MNRKKDVILRATVALTENYKKEELFMPKNNRELPSRAAVIDVVKELRSVIFPGYFWNDSAAKVFPEYFAGYRLNDLYDRLKEQIEIALLYAQPELEQEGAEEEADRICAGFFEQLPEVQQRLLKDVQAGFDGDPAAKSKEEIIKTAVDGAIMVKELADKQSGNIYLQYSPESCTGTEVDYAVEICNAVLDIWQPTPDHKAIINIPATVENSIPHVFATQIEYIHKHLKYRDAVLLSLHPHNDRGCAVADAELGVLAGADRIEGTLFGNGERTGNMDIVTMAMNLFSHGIDPELDFSDISAIRAGYETYTGMKVHERQPYAGDLVFTAFSGSHQDAISKGMTWREEHKTDKWTVPYLPIDPKDIGRTYDSDVIRINSQSGKGGISYILKQNFGVVLPEAMREDVGYAIKQVSDEMHQELSPQNVYEIFEEQYLHSMNYFRITESHFKQLADGIMAEVTILNGEKETVIDANGNGRLDAVSNAVKQFFNIDYTLMNYEEHALTQTTSSKAIAYVCIKKDNTTYWGAGIDEDIIKASIQALCVSVNKMLAVQKGNACEDVRLTKMLNYIQNHYQNVTLADMSQEFHLTEPYISKYIREKSGVTFGEHVTNIRMKKACTLLKNGNMTAENIAASIGYPNVEHFSRTFKKKYHMTPIQYRESKN